MTLTSGVLKTCARTLRTRIPNSIVRSARFFFMLMTHGPQKIVGHVTSSEPSHQGGRGRVRSRRTRGSVGAPSKRETGLKPRGIWQHRSPPRLGCEARSHRTYGSTGALSSREARSNTMRYMTALEVTLTGRQSPKMQDI
jgi:hypothetical protein